jgi:pilus assembly protein Flp/PilA
MLYRFSITEGGDNEMLTKLYVSMQSRFHTMRNEEGATAVEYGMLVALIAAVIVGVVTTLGTQVQAAFQSISDALP